MIRAITSASNLARRAVCPGSEALEAQFAEPPDSEYSAEGTLLHKWFWSKAERPITGEPLDALVLAESLTRKVFADFSAMMDIPEDALTVDTTEETLEVRDEDGTLLVPGHADLIRMWPEQGFAAIIDAKFGRAEVEEAPENLQLSMYAVGLAQRSPLNAIVVAIVQPRNFGTRVTQALYRPQGIAAAFAAIRKIALDCKVKDAPRAVSSECKFCKACPVCPEYKEGLQLFITAKPLAVSTLPNLELGTLKHIINRAKQLESEVTEEIRQRIIAGTIEGWSLRNAGSTRTLTDALPALRAIQGYLAEQNLPAMSAKAFDGARKLVWGELESLFVTLTGYTQKRAKEVLKELLSPVTIETPKSQSVIEDK